MLLELVDEVLSPALILLHFSPTFAQAQGFLDRPQKMPRQVSK
jgi:hypothetical protein